MRFTKMHGLGNDYVYVSLFEQSVPEPASLARAISDRHRGIGSDGLILIGPSEPAHLRMVMYNADGSRGEMCGNGLRCVAKYAYEQGLCARPDLLVETDVGVRRVECAVSGRTVVSVRAEMGTPEFNPGGFARSEGRELINEPIQVNGRPLSGTFVSVGSPHWVVFVSDWSEIDLRADGAALERHEMFPQRTNVHFAHVENPQRVSVLTWERGTGPTEACGSGACAVAAAAERLGRARLPMTVHLHGGELLIESGGDSGKVLFQTGPAEEVFSGEFPWPAAGSPM